MISHRAHASDMVRANLVSMVRNNPQQNNEIYLLHEIEVLFHKTSGSCEKQIQLVKLMTLKTPRSLEKLGRFQNLIILT